jgi:DNA-binding PadR family transcriptional regulator
LQNKIISSHPLVSKEKRWKSWEAYALTEIERSLVKATLRGFNRVTILWLVSQKRRSGYEVVKEMKRLTGQSFHSGVVYPLLYELEQKKLITGKWVTKGRRRINYYSITNRGNALLKRLHELFEMPVREVLKDLLGEKHATSKRSTKRA